MDFSRVELSDDDQAFRDEVRDVPRRARHRRRAAAATARPATTSTRACTWRSERPGTWRRSGKPESDGGFTRVRRRIWELEKRRAHVPWVTWGTTIDGGAFGRAQFGSPELRAEVLPGVFSGHVRLCLGYTEPDGGSDIATCKTRAVRDGDDWVINGSKMFTTGAHNCQYVFLHHQHRSARRRNTRA